MDYWFGLLVYSLHGLRTSLTTVDLAAILKGVISLEVACDSSDPSLLDVILIWLMINELKNYSNIDCGLLNEIFSPLALALTESYVNHSHKCIEVEPSIGLPNQ